MSALKLKSLRFVGIGVLALFLLAMSFSFVHQGHSYSTSHSDFNSSAATGSSLELNHVSPNTLVTDVCIGAIFLILFFGRKHLFKFSFLRQFLNSDLNRWRALSFTRPPNLVLRLSLPQLGVFRI